MCESCESEGISRRGFLGMGLGASAGMGLAANLQGSAAYAAPVVNPEKRPARVMIDRVEVVCSIYSGPHPILCCANRAESVRMKAFANLSRLKLAGNI